MGCVVFCVLVAWVWLIPSICVSDGPASPRALPPPPAPGLALAAAAGPGLQPVPIQRRVCVEGGAIEGTQILFPVCSGARACI